jgi:hypothetical protein
VREYEGERVMEEGRSWMDGGKKEKKRQVTKPIWVNEHTRAKEHQHRAQMNREHKTSTHQRQSTRAYHEHKSILRAQEHTTSTRAYYEHTTSTQRAHNEHQHSKKITIRFSIQKKLRLPPIHPSMLTQASKTKNRKKNPQPTRLKATVVAATKRKEIGSKKRHRSRIGEKEGDVSFVAIPKENSSLLLLLLLPFPWLARSRRTDKNRKSR